MDWAGRCCTQGPVDACGVCGGTGVAVDVLGRCCLSALLPSGLCCEDGEPDSCGVCGGLNTCSAQVQVSLKAATTMPDLDAAVVMLSEVLGALGVAVTNVTLGLESHTLAFAITTVTPGVSVSNEDIVGSIAAQVWYSGVTVDRAPVCGNGLCELGEGCVGSSCNASASLCLQDCPQSAVRCPLELGRPCAGHGACVGATGTTGYCKCRAGYTGDACFQCAPQYYRRGTACIFMPGALASCSDGVKNGREEGVDCGGGCGTACTARAPVMPGAGVPWRTIVVAVVVSVGLALAVLMVLRCWRRWCGDWARRLRKDHAVGGKEPQPLWVHRKVSTPADNSRRRRSTVVLVGPSTAVASESGKSAAERPRSAGFIMGTGNLKTKCQVAPTGSVVKPPARTVTVQVLPRQPESDSALGSPT